MKTSKSFSRVKKRVLARKKAFSVLMAFCLALALVPAVGFAEVASTVTKTATDTASNVPTAVNDTPQASVETQVVSEPTVAIDQTSASTSAVAASTLEATPAVQESSTGAQEVNTGSQGIAAQEVNTGNQGGSQEVNAGNQGIATQGVTETVTGYTVPVYYKGSVVTAKDGKFVFGDTDVSMGATNDGMAYSGNDAYLPLIVGENVVLSFTDIPPGQAVTVVAAGGQKTILASDIDKSFSFNMTSDVKQIDITIGVVVPKTTVKYQNNPVTPTEGAFAFGESGVTMTAAVGEVPYAGDSADIPAALDSSVVLTFAGIPEGKAVTVDTAAGKKSIASTDTDKTYTFTMSAATTTISISVGDEGVTNVPVVFEGNPVAAASGTFTFGTNGPTMGATINNAAYTGSDFSLALKKDDAVSLSFVVPDGQAITVTAGENASKTITSASEDKTYVFTMSDTIKQIDIYVGDASAVQVPVKYNDAAVTAANGVFSFGETNITMTGAKKDGATYTGSTNYLPVKAGDTEILTFDNVSEGKTVTVTAGETNKTITAADRDKTFSFTKDASVTQITISVRVAATAELSYQNSKVVPASGTFTFGGSGVTCNAKVGDADYSGNSGDIPGYVGDEVILTFANIPTGKVVVLDQNGTKTVIAETDASKVYTFIMSNIHNQINVAIENALTTSIIYQGEKLAPANGTFKFTPTSVECTIKVGDTVYAGNSADIPAKIGDTVEVVFTGIPAGGSITASVNGQQKQITSTNPTYLFTMADNTNPIQVDVPSTTVVWSGGTPTVFGGEFTFVGSGVTMTTLVGSPSGQVITGYPYRGTSTSIPAVNGNGVYLDFSIPAGQTLSVEVQTEAAPQKKTLTSDDHTFSFIMSEQSRTIAVSTSATFSLAAEYNDTYKSTYGAIQYRINEGEWTDIATGTTVTTGQYQSVERYNYTLPSGTADIKIIQPTDGQGKYTTNDGKGWMGDFQDPDGGGLQPSPSEFNGANGYVIKGYGTGEFRIDFTQPFGSLSWSSVPAEPFPEAVLKNGTVLIKDLTNAAVFDQMKSHQALDGTEGFAAIINPTATITATLTPARGYQVLSTNIRGADGQEVTLTPDKDNACTFTFNVAYNINMPIYAVFSEVKDTATSTSAKVSDVSFTGAEQAIASGNLNMTVVDATTDTTAADTARGGTAVATVDVTLDQYWNQGSVDTRWTNKLTSLDEPATVTMQLDATLQLADGETYQVVRDHNGTKTVVDSTYDADTNTLSFSSNEYSEFTLVKSAAPAVEASATMRYNGSDVVAAGGTFTYGMSGVSSTAKVAGTAFVGSTANITANVGDDVVLTFAGIVSDDTVKVTVNGTTQKVTAASNTCTFTMKETTKTIEVETPSTQVVWSGGTPTVNAGTFTFGATGITATAEVTHLQSLVPFTGNSPIIPAVSGDKISLNFNIPAGKTIDASVQTASGLLTKTLTSTDNAFTFTMDSASTKITLTSPADGTGAVDNTVADTTGNAKDTTTTKSTATSKSPKTSDSVSWPLVALIALGGLAIGGVAARRIRIAKR